MIAHSAEISDAVRCVLTDFRKVLVGQGALRCSKAGPAKNGEEWGHFAHWTFLSGPIAPNGDFYLPFLIIFIIKYYIKVKRFIGKVYINPCELSKSNKPTINKTRRAVVESAPDCAPHLGQAGALSDTSVPHSLHATKAIIHLAFSVVIWS